MDKLKKIKNRFEKLENLELGIAMPAGRQVWNLALGAWSFFLSGLKEFRRLVYSIKPGRIVYYLRIWTMMSKNSFMIMLSKKLLFFLFLSGKLVRFTFFTLFLFYLVSGAESLAGYSLHQTIFFFLTFNLVDVIAQFLFREVYKFRGLLVSGDFDLVLVKPMGALFRSLMGGADVIDLVTIPPLIVATWYVGGLLDPTFSQVIFYVLLVANGLLIATAFHIAVISLGILTLEVDHTIFIYRDLTGLGKLPIDIYKQPLRAAITFLIPVGIMITLPAKALMGLVGFNGVLLSLFLGFASLFISFKFWKVALRSYTSASS